MSFVSSKIIQIRKKKNMEETYRKQSKKKRSSKRSTTTDMDETSNADTVYVQIRFDPNDPDMKDFVVRLSEKDRKALHKLAVYNADTMSMLNGLTPRGAKKWRMLRIVLSAVLIALLVAILVFVILTYTRLP